MQKIALAIIAGSLFMAGVTQAASNDKTATLSITGNVQNGEQDCAVELSSSSMKLGTYDINELPMQGVDSTQTTQTNVVRVLGDNCDASGLSVKFLGTTDDQEGNSFTNTTTGSAAAQGIGVSLYTTADTVITPNSSSLLILEKQYLFKAGMVKIKNATTSPGLVQSSMTVQVERL
ncbi:fimbrial protein [Cronobacter dublinensis]|mgnify:FL=1|uniref:fimbrial protein n=1 Tax=Cronobacter dublinensis TaxID=413497 RepID=UPI0005187F0C|nr:fimbrial protein [Cronobacter dublinensis]MDI6441943.1 fimbrial protein [Cronobacter dublinensis]NCH95845.1 type 1 fimbrial protein [Cronobacter dublinensis]